MTSGFVCVVWGTWFSLRWNLTFSYYVSLNESPEMSQYPSPLLLVTLEKYCTEIFLLAYRYTCLRSTGTIVITLVWVTALTQPQSDLFDLPTRWLVNTNLIRCNCVKFYVVCITWYVTLLLRQDAHIWKGLLWFL